MSTYVRRILVPTDFSDTANHALRYASQLAQSLGAHLTVVYSDLFMPPIDFTATVGGWDDFALPLMKQRAEKELRKEARAGIPVAVPYEAVVRVAAPLDGILAQAREGGAELIVMGTHGRTGIRRAALGSVTEAVMRQADIPVLAIPPRIAAKPSIRTVVCPVVYNAQCLTALTRAAAIVPPEARFIVIRATPADDLMRFADDYDELRSWVPEEIAGRCEFRMFGSEHVVNHVQAFVKSVHADLIVAAEPAERSAADLLHGTFAVRLVQQSGCPVLTVSEPAALAASPTSRQGLDLAASASR
jgi:nucleotide-binding universal stress UspA family protein